MKKKLVIIIDVENRQESYYSYIDLYMACKKNDVYMISQCSKKTNLYWYIDVNFQNTRKLANTVERLYSSNELNRLSEIELKRYMFDKICLYFRLSLDDNSDVTNLLYYFLIKQYLEAEDSTCPVSSQLLIDTQDSVEMRYKIAQFLVFESKKEASVFIKSSDFIKYGYAVNLPGMAQKSTYEVHSLEKFCPLLEIREDTYKMLSDTIYSILATEGSGQVEGFPERTSKNYMDSSVTSKDILIDMCLYYLTGEGSKYVKERTKAFFYNGAFFDTVKNMNLLSFLIMCSFEFYLSQEHMLKCDSEEAVRELSLSSFHKKIDLSNNLASGLLQIIENIIAHTKYHRGYFSFRILSDESGYLHQNYETYLHTLQQKGLRCEMHLEVKVCDLNLDEKGYYSSAITQCFFENLDRRIKKSDNGLQMWRKKFDDICVKDFFIIDGENQQDMDIWKDYYAIKENWLHHYGLRLYARIVNKACGLFKVNSQIGLKKEPEKQYFSTLDSDDSSIDYLPGTQYNIILPYVAQTINQEPIGIDTNINLDQKLQELIDENQEIHVENMEHLFEEICREENGEGEIFTNFQSQKEYYVERVELEIRKRYTGVLMDKKISPSKLVFIIDTEGVANSLMQEVVAKAIWSYVCSKECTACREECKEYTLFAIANCNFELINYLTATIAIYFGLNFNKKICGKAQLYICENNGEDFLISGSTLTEIRARAYKFAASRGIFPNILTYLFRDLGETPSNISANSGKLLVEPFDILIHRNGEARFMDLVKKVMDKEIFYPDYGCKLSSVHIKLGSKIHIHNFYEAEILFQDSYFSKRMAYFVVKDIITKIGNETKRLVLVGYENYSEMFLYDIHKFLGESIKRRKMGVLLEDYIVCMDVNGELELNRNDFMHADDMEFIIVVSLNSSLTTFCKIKAALEKNTVSRQGKLKIFANYAVVLFRDDFNDKLKIADTKSKPSERMTNLEHRFWHRIDSDSQMVKSRFIEQEIKYFISGIAGWEDPLVCPMCFPDSFITEKPLIYTNKTSIIPFMQYGIVQKHGNAIWIESASRSKAKKKLDLQKWDELDRINKSKAEILANNVKYGHIRRNDNHFLYYFDTKSLFEDSKTGVRDWLKNIRDQMKEASSEKNDFFAVYNILVTSIHESNTGFVEMINDCVFNNAAYIIRFEVNRTYRDNLVARYSNLTLLYQRLLDIANETNDYAQINFYYADDTIVSGRTYERAKSLIGSLYGKINDELQKKCGVNIFAGCFLLLNRLSDESERGVLGEGCVSYKYYDVPISSIRNHEDFCFMCNLIKSASQLCAKSSTNEIAQRWKKVEHRFRLKEYYKYKLDSQKEIRYQNRFYSAYWSNLELKRLREEAEDTKKVCQMIADRLLDRRMAEKETDEEKFEILFSYIKVLSRPFFNYRWRNREAILCIIILLLEVLLNEEICKKDHVIELVNESGNFEKNTKLVRILMLVKKHRTITKNKSLDDLVLLHNMLVIFIKQAMELNSNYIIRKKNIIRIMTMHRKIQENFQILIKEASEKNKYQDDIISIQNFNITYTRYIKQLIALSGDEKKSIWFEKLLLTGNEYGEKVKENDEVFLKDYGIKSDLGKGFYIENTSALDDAIKAISSEIIEEADLFDKSMENKIEKILNDKNRYYLKSFLEMLELNGFLKINESEEGEIECLPILKEVMNLYMMLSKAPNSNELENFYRDLMIQFAAILHSEMCQCLIIINESEKEDVFCLFEIYQKNQNYILSDSVGIPTVQRKDLDHSDNILKTFGFVEDKGEDSKNYLILKFESDVAEIHFDEEEKYESGMIIRPLYFVFEVKDMKQEEIIKRLRFILAMRSYIVKKIELDFKNNSFQKMIEEKNKKTLLSNWKNATHADDWIYSQVISFMFDFQERLKDSGVLQSECDIKNYIHKIEGTILRLLSDSNISSKYHSSLTMDLDRKYDLENPSIYAVTMPLRHSIMMKYLDSLLRMPQKNKNEMVCKGIEIAPDIKERKLFYFAGEQEQSMLIIIPIIQNALKYCKNGNWIKVDCEPGALVKLKDGTKNTGLDYLCIRNPLAEDKVGIAEQMKDCIKLPVGMRRKSQLDSQNGISLYAVNKYIEKLIETIYKQPIDFSDPPLQIEYKENSMVVKLPMIQGTIKRQKGETHGKIYYC